MSRRMSSSRWLWIIEWLFFAASLNAEPPKSELAPPLPVDRAAVQIQIDAVIYEVDPVKLAKLADKTKSPVAELLKLNGFNPFPKEQDRLAVVQAVRDGAFSFDVHGQDVTLAFTRRMSPTVSVLAGREANVIVGGQYPILVPTAAGAPGTEIQWHEFGTKLTVRPIVDTDGLLRLSVRVEDSQLGEPTEVAIGENSVEVPSLRVRAVTLTAKLKSSQTLLIANGTSESDLTQFVQLTPRVLTHAEIATLPIAAPPAMPAKAVDRATSNVAPATVNGDGTITIENRWPIADVKVGQNVMVLSVSARRNQLFASFCYAGGNDDYMCEVVAVKPNAGGPGQIVTLRPGVDESHKKVKPRDVLNLLRDFSERSVAMFVLPMSHYHDGVTPLQEALDAVPSLFVPKPIELLVGASYHVMFNPKNCVVLEQDEQLIELTHPDREPNSAIERITNVVARQPGLAKLTYLYGGDPGMAVTRMTFLVKADTRELEQHLRRLFPSAKVVVTSLGGNSLMLQGTAASDEDSRGIVELAEQFAPKVLNRLHVGVPTSSRTRESSDRSLTTSATDSESSASKEPRRMGTPARPIQPASAEEPQGTGKSAHPTKPVKTPQKSNGLRELRDEIRELRQDVRELIQRLDREQATNRNDRNSLPDLLGDGNRVARPESSKGVADSHALRRASERATQPASELKAAFPPEPVLPADVNERAWQMLGVHVAPLTDAETKQLGPKYRGGMKLSVLRPDSPAAKNGIRQGDILVGLHVWETCSFDNLHFVLTHPQLAMLGKLKFYIVRSTETLFGDLPLVAASQPMSEATKSEPLSLQPAVVGVTENRVRIARQLDTVVELDANELSLAKVIDQLARKADINIVLDKAGLEEAGVTAATPVTRTLKGVKLRSVLKIVLSPLKLTDVIDGEVLKITSLKRAAGPMIVVAYPVSDLFQPNEAVQVELENLMDLVRGCVARESWDKVGGPGSIVRNTPGKSLFVRQTQAVHDELRDFLELLRKTVRPANARNAAAGLSNLSEEELRITRQLGKTIDLEIERGTLEIALNQLRQLGDFNVVIDESGLADESLTLKTPVSIRVKGVRLATALRLLLEPLNLDYVLKNDVLQVTSLACAAGRAILVTYSVTDLLQSDQPPHEELDRLSELIQSMIDPNSWEAVGGGAAIKGNPTTQSLVVRQTQTNQARIRELLETMRKLGDRKEAPAASKPPTRGTPPLSAVEPDRRVGKEKEKEIAARLKAKVSVHFENVPLSQLLEHLSRESKIDIVLDDKGLADESLTPTTPASLSVDGIALESVLTLMLEPLNLSFVIEPNGLKVTSSRRIQEALIPVTYAVADLVCPIEGLEIQLTKDGASTPEKKMTADNAATLSFEELVKLIRSTVVPTSWSEVGGEGLIKSNPDTLSLVVRQTPAAHDEIRDLLEQLRRLQDLQVSFELRVLKFDAGFPGVSSLLPKSWNEASAKKPLLLSAEQLDALLKAATDRDHRNSLWQAPKITLLNGQRVLLSTDSDSPVSPLRVVATHAVSADRESVRINLAADAGSSNYSITTHVPNGQSLLFNVTDASIDGAQTGIPILAKVLNADRLFKNVTKSALKSGESLFLLATPRVIVVEEEDAAPTIPH